MKTLRRIAIAVVFCVLAIGIIAPFSPAETFRPRIQAALEAALNRRVTIGAVHLNLFHGPGFAVENVLIEDESGAGIEPFAHVASIQARVELGSLFTGKLAFSNLRLVEPHVNLVKTSAGPWNIQPLLTHAANAPNHRHSAPDIEIASGRLNFKFGDTKSVFFIDNADIDAYPNENGDLVVRFSGDAARTDRGPQGFGHLTARGMLRSGPDGEDQLTMGLRLDRTSISDLLALFSDGGAGIHGYAIADARLTGPLSKLDITGNLEIADMHRWDLMPTPGTGWKIRYRGRLDPRAQQLELETVALDQKQPPVSVRLRAADYLTRPRWGVCVTFRELAAASLAETARHMGAPLPAGVGIDGKVSGVIGYTPQGGAQGELAFEDASVKWPDAASVQFEAAPILIADNQFALGPAEVRLESGQSAQLEANYALDGRASSFRITTRGLPIAEVQSGAARVFASAPVPLLEDLHSGVWKGWIAFEKQDERPGVWTGEYDLQNAALDLPGLAAPVRLISASVQLEAGVIRMNRVRGRVGDIRFDGDYRFDSAAEVPNRVRMNIPGLQLAELERVMLPALRRQEGFLARTFNLRRAPLPRWLKDRAVEGTIQVGELSNGDAPLGSWRASFAWDGPSIELNRVECHLDEMRATGNIAIDLSDALPAYKISANVSDLDYRNGRLDLVAELETKGIGQSLLLNAQAEGTFEGRGITLGPDADMREISGSYSIGAVDGIPRLVLSNLQVTQGPDTLVGQGSSQPDGRVVLDLTSGRRQVRMTGMLLPMHPDIH
jgi:hypothetical protein